MKIAFVSLLCGSSYLAGSLWGRHSLELSLTAPVSVESLVNGAAGLGGVTGDAGVDCEHAREQFIESKVKEGAWFSLLDPLLVVSSIKEL